MNLDDQFAIIEQNSGISAAEWQDLLTLPPADLTQAIADWVALGKMTWTKSPSALGAVLDALAIIGTIAGVVSGVAGAATAVAALKAI